MAGRATILMLMAHNDRFAIAVHDADAPTDDEWSRWLGHFKERPELREARALIESRDGAGPNAKQRKQLAENTKGVDVRAAVLTESLLVRGIVTAIAWAGIPQRAYALAQYEQAADFLELTPAERAWARAELSKLRSQLAAAEKPPASSHSRL